MNYEMQEKSTSIEIVTKIQKIGILRTFLRGILTWNLASLLLLQQQETVNLNLNVVEVTSDPSPTKPAGSELDRKRLPF